MPLVKEVRLGGEVTVKGVLDRAGGGSARRARGRTGSVAEQRIRHALSRTAVSTHGRRQGCRDGLTCSWAWSIDHCHVHVIALQRRSPVPTLSGQTTNIWALCTFLLKFENKKNVCATHVLSAFSCAHHTYMCSTYHMYVRTYCGRHRAKSERAKLSILHPISSSAFAEPLFSLEVCVCACVCGFACRQKRFVGRRNKRFAILGGSSLLVYRTRVGTTVRKSMAHLHLHLYLKPYRLFSPILLEPVGPAAGADVGALRVGSVRGCDEVGGGVSPGDLCRHIAVVHLAAMRPSSADENKVHTS